MQYIYTYVLFMWHFLNKLWRSVLLILCLHRCNNSTIVDKFFNNYVKIQIEKTKIVCLAFTHVSDSTISRKKITTRRCVTVENRYIWQWQYLITDETAIWQVKVSTLFEKADWMKIPSLLYQCFNWPNTSYYCRNGYVTV